MSRRVPPRGFFNGESPFGRVPPQPSLPTIRLSRRGVTWIILVVLAGVLVLLLQPFATLYTDWLWFRSLGYGNVFGVRFTAQLVTFFVFAILFWAIGAANVLLALGSNRRLSTIGIKQRLLTAPSSLLALLGIFLTGLIFGRIASAQWQTILTFLNRVPFNVTDPIWHQDVSFYVFGLPFYRFLWGWFLAVDILMVFISLGLYAYRSGFQTLVLTGRAIRHLTVLAAAFAALLAVHYRLDLFELLLSRRGFVYGAGYTDVSARIPSYWIMVGLMLLVTALLLFNLVRPRLGPIAVGAGAWLAAAFVLLVIFPGFVQRIQVTPDELHKETPYIAHEIAFTRQAFGLAAIADQAFTPKDAVTAADVNQNPETVQNARLWDPQLALPATFQNLQSLRTYYDFTGSQPPPIAVDRYHLDNGQYIQLLLAARELNSANLPPSAQGWVNLKLQYTHGYGVVAARANEATDQGLPVLTLKDIPPSGEPRVTQPAIYFGRQTNDYVLVDSKQQEFDFPAETNHFTHWTGKTGVRLSSGLRSLAFALRFGDVNILLSPDLTADTQVLFRRQIQDRISTLAPFLQLDRDPYIVVAGGQLYWIQDAYTVSTRYPYSQVSLSSTDSPLAGVNYVRNSVKVVVNADEGTTTLYQIDSQDPIVRTYASIFPGLFKPFSEMPAELQAHIRYPRDLFSTQAEMFTLYHMQDPTVFYQKEDFWMIGTESLQQGQLPQLIRPFFVFMRLPDQPRAEFVTILPYTPNNKNNLIAYLVARSDTPNYGQLLDFRFPKDSLIVGPQQVESNIDQAPVIKSQFTLLNSSGSSTIRGNLLVLPIENSLLYIEPVYLQAENLHIPELKKVIVATGQQVVMEDSLDQALAALLGSAPPTPTSPGPTVGVNPTIAQLINQEAQDYAAAQDDLKRGDLAGYAQQVQAIGQIIQRLQALEQGSSTTPTPSPSPTASH